MHDTKVGVINFALCWLCKKEKLLGSQREHARQQTLLAAAKQIRETDVRRRFFN